MFNIGAIAIRKNRIVIGDAQGHLLCYTFEGPFRHPEILDEKDCNSAIISLSMDDTNTEGLVGTEAG
jgi:hypothetical protein